MIRAGNLSFVFAGTSVVEVILILDVICIVHVNGYIFNAITFVDVI